MYKAKLITLLLVVALSLSACTSNVPPPPAQSSSVESSSESSSTPSSEPSSTPSSTPLSEPLSEPSSAPSSAPSSTPSSAPSSALSSAPSSALSSKPSSAPSSAPAAPKAPPSNQAAAKVPTPQEGVAGIEDSIFAKVNELRTSLGLHTYTRSSVLDSSALIRSAEMYGALKLTHTRPNGSLYQTAMDEVGYKYSGGQENIGEANNFPIDQLAQTFYDGWLNSPSHYKAMVNPDLTEMGIALYGDINNFFAAQHFAAPELSN